MNTADRLKKIREVETTVAKLVKKGWKVEKVEHIDEDGEPFRTVVSLAVEGTSALDGTF